MRSVVESGECLVRLLITEPTHTNPIGLRLQILESDHLHASRTGTIGGAITVQGITLDATGASAAYWLFPQHPGAAWYLPGSNQSSVPVPAAEVLHIHRKRRPGQLRDVSWLAPILLRLCDLGDYEAALLMKAKIEACLAAVVTEEGDEVLTGPAAGLLRDAQGRPVESFEPGMILYRRGSGSIEVVNPSGGGTREFASRGHGKSAPDFLQRPEHDFVNQATNTDGLNYVQAITTHLIYITHKRGKAVWIPKLNYNGSAPRPGWRGTSEATRRNRR